MDELLCPPVVHKILRASHAMRAHEIDTDDLCYWVSDWDWQEILRYMERFAPSDQSIIGIKKIRLAGIEVIKRSAHSAGV